MRRDLQYADDCLEEKLETSLAACGCRELLRNEMMAVIIGFLVGLYVACTEIFCCSRC